MSTFARYSNTPTTWKPPVAALGDLPATGNVIGDVRVTEDTSTIWVWNGTSWVAIASSGVNWGSIGGTLSNQTDLQNALNAKLNATIVLSVAVNTTAAAAPSTNYAYLVSGTTVLTLPTAVGNLNMYTVKNVGVGVVTIATTSSQTIDGSLTAPMPVQYTSLTLVSNGSNWSII